jgi:uncharacterized protein YlzI (FlbEa/FlbD family)
MFIELTSNGQLFLINIDHILSIDKNSDRKVRLWDINSSGEGDYWEVDESYEEVVSQIRGCGRLG